MSPLDRLLAEHEIARLVTRYAIMNDDGDFQGLAATFTDDGSYTRPSGGDPVVGRDAILASYTSRPPRTSRHVIANIVVDVSSDDEATCRSTMLLYIGAPGDLPTISAGPALLGGSRDRLVRTTDGWRFVERIGYLDMKIA